MARKNRVWFPGAVYHIISRGNRRKMIYRDESDYLDFLERLEKVKIKHDLTIHSICLMTNHFHMLIGTEDVEIWKTMHMLLHPYAADFNRKYILTGHLFENRYIGKLIDSDSYFLETSRYIHLNPVKAGIVRRPMDYRYSSCADFLFTGRKKKTAVSHLVDPSVVLSYFGDNPREKYRLFLRDSSKHEENEMLIRKDMRDGDEWR